MPESVTSRPFRYEARRIAQVTFARTLQRRWILFVCLTVGGMLAMAYGDKRPFSSTLLMPAAVAVALWVAYRMQIIQLRKPVNRALFQTQTLTLSPSLLTVAYEEGEDSAIALKDVQKVDRLMKFTLLHLSGSHAYYIPDGIWNSSDDERIFRELLAANVQERG